MANLAIYKVNTLPATLVANAIYVVKNGTASNIYVTDTAGNAVPLAVTGLATVATSGSYNDLLNKPTIPAQFAPVAGAGISITGTYPALTIANTITNNNQLTNGAGYVTATTANNNYINNQQSFTQAANFQISGFGKMANLINIGSTYLGIVTVNNASYTLGDTETFIVPKINCTIYLNPNPGNGGGRYIVISRTSGLSVTINGNGYNIYYQGSAQASFVMPWACGLFFDGTQWQRIWQT